MEGDIEAHRQLRIALRSEQPHSRSDKADFAGTFLSTPNGKPTGYGDRNATQMISHQSAASIRSGLERLGAATGSGLRGESAHDVACRRRDHDAYCRILWQDNFLTRRIPFVFAPSIYARLADVQFRFRTRSFR